MDTFSRSLCESSVLADRIVETQWLVVVVALVETDEYGILYDGGQEENEEEYEAEPPEDPLPLVLPQIPQHHNPQQ